MRLRSLCKQRVDYSDAVRFVKKCRLIILAASIGQMMFDVTREMIALNRFNLSFYCR
ncbi:hypothetical protein C8R34_101187 [Nitrosomonas sp. Nm84]|nr:hypothetical protein C8R34_101187 [Nitrosomonas sp. Nm84]